jgi:hypothetical protein
MGRDIGSIVANERLSLTGINGPLQDVLTLRCMKKKTGIKQKAVPAAKPAVTKARTRPATKRPIQSKRTRKVFDDRELFGALPGMSKWAMPLLKELRNE